MGAGLPREAPRGRRSVSRATNTSSHALAPQTLRQRDKAGLVVDQQYHGIVFVQALVIRLAHGMTPWVE